MCIYMDVCAYLHVSLKTSSNLDGIQSLSLSCWALGHLRPLCIWFTWSKHENDRKSYVWFYFPSETLSRMQNDLVEAASGWGFPAQIILFCSESQHSAIFALLFTFLYFFSTLLSLPGVRLRCCLTLEIKRVVSLVFHITITGFLTPVKGPTSEYNNANNDKAELRFIFKLQFALRLSEATHRTRHLAHVGQPKPHQLRASPTSCHSALAGGAGRWEASASPTTLAYSPASSCGLRSARGETASDVGWAVLRLIAPLIAAAGSRIWMSIYT